MIYERLDSGRRFPALAAILFAVATCAPGSQASAGDLAVEIAGVRGGDGGIYVSIYGPGSAEGFPGADDAEYRFRLPAREGRVRFALPEVASGRYAMAAFHDENGNGRLDANLAGIPVEGYGFSRDAAAVFGPPSFEDAAFDLVDRPAAVRVTLSY